MDAISSDRWYSEKRLGGLSRFALAITVLNVLGHAFLGFEQPWCVPFVAVGTAYGVELLAETLEARCLGRRPRYAGSIVDVIKFLLPAHISGLAAGMLLYGADQIRPVIFAVTVAIASKYLLRLTVGVDSKGVPVRRHFFNPSNLGITATLVLFPLVGIAPPYQFAENTSGIFDWLIPLVIVGTGSFLNSKATGRIPLILAWLGAFAIQALVRAAIENTPPLAGLMPMTGFAFILFTFYMITDPATTPSKPLGQVLFGASVSIAYALLMAFHVVFGLFFALTLVSGARGLGIAMRARFSAPARSPAVAQH